MPDEAEIAALAGHRFPGGRYTIAHWENALLSDCTGVAPLPGGQVHPVALFHVPILGANTSIGEMFALGQADNDASIGIESYDWTFHKSLFEEVEYRVEGEITAAARHRTEKRTYDRIQFRFDVPRQTGEPVARSTVTWHYTRNTL